jgi:penicillin-binding protein-related factor A (putative recombinase)
MAKNTGKSSEQKWEDHFTALGKTAFFYRVVDAAEVRGRTGKIGFVRPAPSDYILVHQGRTSFAEVKSTQNATSFPFSLLRRTQSAIAVQVVSAGGNYDIYAHNLVTDVWYKFPYQLVTETKRAGKASIPWSQLQDFTYAL